MGTIVGLDKDLAHEAEYDHYQADNDEEDCKQGWEDVVRHFGTACK